MAAGFGPIHGLNIGHAHDEAALTGCTVLLCEQGAVAACDIRGGAVGERELEPLRPGHVVERIHALVFAGGSAFGLDAASGVMRWCEERGIGFDTGVVKVPIVPAVILFDLRIGDPKRRPDAAMGYAASEAAARAGLNTPVAEGDVGAGMGATVGKLFGIERAMKGGIGCWTEEVAASDGSGKSVRISALAAVNAFGDIRNLETGRIIAGARLSRDSREFVDTAAALRRGTARKGFEDPNTVLVAVATDAALTKHEAQRLATMAAGGMSRVVSPVHTRFDGDVVFALSVGDLHADVNALGAAAADAVAHAIARGVTQAVGAGGVPGLRDWQ
jgi:L-aminopeptidase/D-esterase-like protein